MGEKIILRGIPILRGLVFCRRGGNSAGGICSRGAKSLYKPRKGWYNKTNRRAWPRQIIRKGVHGDRPRAFPILKESRGR